MHFPLNLPIITNILLFELFSGLGKSYLPSLTMDSSQKWSLSPSLRKIRPGKTKGGEAEVTEGEVKTTGGQSKTGSSNNKGKQVGLTYFSYRLIYQKSGFAVLSQHPVSFSSRNFQARCALLNA